MKSCEVCAKVVIVSVGLTIVLDAPICHGKRVGGWGGREVGGPAEVNILSLEKRYRMGQSWSRV